jgi:hypothetical protein
MKKYTSFLCILLTAGCASSVGNKSSVALYNRSTEGLGTAEIMETYGKPTASWPLGNGNTVHQYQYATQRHSPLAYLPFIYYFTSPSGANYETVLIVNNDDVLEIKKFYSRFKSSNAGVCSRSSSATQCIKHVE